jgi:hypothetical protein
MALGKELVEIEKLSTSTVETKYFPFYYILTNSNLKVLYNKT